MAKTTKTAKTPAEKPKKRASKPTGNKRGRPRKVQAGPNQPELPFGKAFAGGKPADKDIAETLKFFLKYRATSDQWRGLAATPSGSLLDKVIQAFKSRTNIPLEIPFFTVISYISAHLLQADAKIRFGNSTVHPGTWIVILASSGSSKSWTANTLTKFVGKDNIPMFPNPASGAKYVEDLQYNNKSLWIRDEFGQMLKAMQEQPHMFNLKDYMLRTYDGEELSHRTKKETITIENPALTILGLTVLETFISQVSAESLVDGFAQRFNYVQAKKDPDRPMVDFPIYDLSEEKEGIQEAWQSITAVQVHPEYVLGEKAVESFKASFRFLFKQVEDIPESFYRRIMFSAVRYGLIYHYLLGKESNIIDEQDMAWAARLVFLHLKDVQALLMDSGLGEIERMVQRAEEIRAECRAKKETFNARVLIRRMSAIKNANMARQIIELMAKDEEE